VVGAPVSPADLAATFFAALGVDPRTATTGGRGQGHALSEGSPITALLRAGEAGRPA
jgi:hypothetical protein